MVDLLLVPIALMVLLIAWVQPRDSDLALAEVLSVALPILIAWFGGRADEYLNEGLLSGALIVVVVTVLIDNRRRGRAGVPL